MLHFIETAPQIENREYTEPQLEKYFGEVRKFLPELPKDVSIWLDNESLIAETGTGGFAYNPDTMTISFDANFTDKAQQASDLKGTVFHESYHLVQGHTAHAPKAPYKTALDAAIYEGCATVFEREYTGSKPLWGDYRGHDERDLLQWQRAMMDISADEYWNTPSVWEKLAFYDTDDNQRWKLYKVGTWIVDKAMQTSGIDIVDMRTMSASDIRRLLG